MSGSYEEDCKKLDKSKPAFDEFDGWLKKKGREEYSKINVPLFHYTSVGTLEKIISSNEFWFTSIWKQKRDKREVKSGLQECFCLLGRAAKKAKFSGVQFFSSKAKSIFSKDEISQIGNFYLFCASKIKDDPHQWVEFADGGAGVCIELSPKFIEKFLELSDDSSGSNYIVAPVCYSLRCFRRVVYPFIIKCARCLDKGLDAMNPDQVEARPFLHVMTTALFSHLISRCLKYKPKEFSRENEVRFIIGPDRASAGSVEPSTMKISADDISSITFGPLISDADKNKIGDALSKKSWGSIKTEESTVFFERPCARIFRIIKFFR